MIWKAPSVQKIINPYVWVRVTSKLTTFIKFVILIKTCGWAVEKCEQFKKNQTKTKKKPTLKQHQGQLLACWQDILGNVETDSNSVYLCIIIQLLVEKHENRCISHLCFGSCSDVVNKYTYNIIVAQPHMVLEKLVMSAFNCCNMTRPVIKF